jgi:hypothetical protein
MIANQTAPSKGQIDCDGDIHVRRVRREIPCHFCGEPCRPGELVHHLRELGAVAAHVACGLRARRAVR